MEEVIEVKVTPTRKLFYSDDSSFGIYGCDVGVDDTTKVKLNKHGTITLKGVMPSLNIGEEYIATVKPKEHPDYGMNYVVEAIKQDLPTSESAQKSYLYSILTFNQVESIYEIYEGKDVLDLIKNDEFDYTKVKGIGEKTYEKIKQKVMDNIEMKEVLSWLSQYGLKYNTIAKLAKEFPSPLLLIQKLEKNPYLLTDVKGIGFIKADQIAKQIGIDPNSPNRIDSCVKYIISEENSRGNSYLSLKGALVESQDILKIEKRYILNRFEKGIKGVAIVDGNKVTLSKVFNAEDHVAKSIHAQLDSSKKLNFDMDKFLNEYMEENNLDLTDEQKGLFYNFRDSSLSLLIGNGGTGKSFTLSVLIQAINEMKMTVKLLAPTGKSVKIVESYTGLPASTIHRAIGMGKDEANGGNKKIKEDVVIVDESSMCDIYLVSKLFDAIDNPNVRIIFVGDDFQLPSVGVGNFLYDCINSDLIPKTKLTKVFRQSDGGILDIATKVRLGEKFLENNHEGKKQFGSDALIHAVDQKFMKDGYIFYVNRVLNKYKAEDIMVLSPTRKGELGINDMNKEMQKIINPPHTDKKEHKYGKDTIFRVGDSVINIENTYGVKDVAGIEVDIYNGDMGKITDIDLENKRIMIDFEGTVVGFPFSDMKKVQHSYALTIHKSQGSASKVVILVMDKAHKFQLNANLIYTGMTRATDYLLVISQSETINFGIKKISNKQRKSFLGKLLLLKEIE